MMLQNMDTNIDPCEFYFFLIKFSKNPHLGENFYEFSCGNFQKSTRIPDDQSRVDTFDTLRERLAYNVADLLALPAEQHENESVKKIKNLFNSCLNEGK